MVEGRLYHYNEWLTAALQLYSGPIAESLPSSISAFSHRRSRADSTTSFIYYEGDESNNDIGAESWHKSIY